MNKPLHVLIVEDSEADALLVVEKIRVSGYQVIFERVETEDAMNAALDKKKWDVIIAADKLSRFSAFAALKLVQKKQFDIPFIAVSDIIDEEIAVKIIKEGAQDYLMKGNLTRLCVTINKGIRDAGERYYHKKAEDALRDSEEKMRTILNSIPDVVLWLDTDLRIVWANKTALELNPYAVGKLCYDALSGRNEECPECPIIKAFETGQVERGIVHLRSVTGIGESYWDDVGVPIKDASGKVTGIVKIAKDITESKKTEDDLRETTSYLQNLFDYANAPIIVWDPEFRITQFNHAFEHLTNYTAREVIGQKLRILFPEASRDESLRKITATLSGEHWESVEIPILSKAGDIRIALWNSANIYAENGITLLAIMAQGQDITERKEIEEELKVAMEIKSKFTSMVSHELRTPLAAIKEGITIVLDGSAGAVADKQRDFLDIVKRNVVRLARLINDVLDFQKLDSGRMKFNMEENDINELVKEVQNLMFSSAKEKGLSLIIKLEDKLPKLKFDKDKIIQVLTNFVNNAIKFTEKGSITITTNKEDNVFHIAVQDTGSGIKEKDMPRLFHRFEQLEKDVKKKAGGTGLGLVISKEIIERHGGKIWVESKFGEGTTFHFTLSVEDGG